MTERASTCTDDLETRVRALEGKLSAIAGYDGVPGWIERIEREQARSAESQGKRLEELKTSHARELAAIETDLKSTRESTIDTRARVWATAACGLAVLTAAGVLVKLLL